MAKAQVLTRLVQKTSKVEEAKLRRYDLVFKAWKYINKKYSKVTVEEGVAAIRALTHFVYNNKLTVDNNWL